MSECLACGECCRTMSPLSEGPCPRLVYHTDPYSDHPIAQCACYQVRPQQCRDHDFPFARFCPVGFDFLSPCLRCADDVARRIDTAYSLTKETP